MPSNYILYITLALVAIGFTAVYRSASKDHQKSTARLRDLVKDSGTADEVVSPDKKGKKGTVYFLGKAMRRSRQVNTFYETLSAELYGIGMEDKVGLFILVWIGLTAGAVFLTVFLELPTIISILACAVCAGGPLIFLKIRKGKRKDKLESQLVDALGVICNAMRAGYSFQHSLSTIADEMDDPIAREFKITFDQTVYGLSMGDAMRNMVDRTQSKYIQMVEIAVTIQSMVGGNIITILNNLSESIRTKLALEQEIKSKTASIKLSGTLIGILPIALLLVMQFINPDYSNILFTTKFGMILLGIMIVLEISGFIMINKMSKIKF